MRYEVSGKLPGLSEMAPFLEPLRGSRAWIVPMTGRSGKVLGNNGDTLMHEVFLRILQTFAIDVVLDRAVADMVIVPPSGALLESYGFPDLLAERLRGSEDLPLVIFPSSALFPTRDPVFMFERRVAATTWMLRERPSLDHLEAEWGDSLRSAGIALVLLHDVVALGHEFVPEIIGARSSTKTFLVAPRADRERTAAINSTAPAPRRLGSLAKVSAVAQRSALGRQLLRRVRKRRTDALAAQLTARLDEGVLRLLNGPSRRRVHLDLSSTQFCSFEEYAKALRRAEIVITDRLHVALPAAILGADVYIAEAGYHKLRGVYENSLSEMTNVHLVG
jgi:exopolysaccharide biosynthesis predicted pyruvyltransferase EpsI